MPINAHPDYLAAEKEYLQAYSLEEKIEKLKKMISVAPNHKGAENLRAQLKTRLKKFQSQLEKSKSKKSSSKGIKKEEMQAVVVGITNTGKSTLVSLLSNAKPTISEIKFSTINPTIGMMPYKGTQIQIIENPAVFSEYYDKGITHTADTLLILITNLNQIKDILTLLEKDPGKKTIIFNSFNKNPEELRKISATLKSKRYDYIISNLKKPENLEELKEKIFQTFDKLRIYTKEPGKNIEEAKKRKPMILKPNSTIKDVAEKILKGFSKNIKEIKIWGPSSKFAGQKVGLKHKVKDLDIVEFKTR